MLSVCLVSVEYKVLCEDTEVPETPRLLPRNTEMQVLPQKLINPSLGLLP